MPPDPRRFGESRVFRRFVPVIGLSAVLAPAVASAQTNLDQGKSASQIFASACAECHKSAHSLGKGQSASALTDFLREHYTTNAQQAAALAAYVRGGSGESPIGVAPQSRGQKSKAQQANASREESKPSKPQAKPGARPEEGKPENTKLRRPSREASKPKDETGSRGGLLSIIAPEPKHPPAPASRSRHNEPQVAPRQEPAAAAPEPAAVGHEPAAVAHEPAAVTTEPAPSEKPRQEASPQPAAAAPADAASGEETPVPRDNIPD